jgi:hypothetical protein
VADAESAAAQERSDCERLGRKAAQDSGGIIAYALGSFMASFTGTALGARAQSDDEDLGRGLVFGLGTTAGAVSLSLWLDSSRPPELAEMSPQCREQYEYGYVKENRARRLGSAIFGGFLGIGLAAAIMAITSESKIYSD